MVHEEIGDMEAEKVRLRQAVPTKRKSTVPSAHPNKRPHSVDPHPNKKSKAGVD